jgi:hypothetical protein
MTTAHHSSERAYQKYAWVILLALSILLLVLILIVAGIEDHALEFQKDTGVAWDELMAAYPGVAAAYTLNLRLLYVGYASLPLFSLVVTYFGLRPGHRWAWYALWVLPAALTLTAILLASGRQPGVGAIYGSFAVVAVVGLLLSYRKFFPITSKED